MPEYTTSLIALKLGTLESRVRRIVDSPDLAHRIKRVGAKGTRAIPHDMLPEIARRLGLPVPEALAS